MLFNAAGELSLRTLKSNSGLEDLYGSEVFYPVCVFVTCLLALIMLFGEKVHLIRSSPNLSLFWPLLVISLLPNAKVEIEELMNGFDVSRLVLTITLVPVCLLLSLLQFWPDIGDLEPKYDDLAPHNRPVLLLTFVTFNGLLIC